MKQLDVVIRNGTLVTASDIFRADIGIFDGRISIIGSQLGEALSDIDAAGKLVMPGGVDAHCHLDQPTIDGSVMADDFLTGTRSAACGGNTTVIPFAYQFRGQPLRSAVDDYHARANGKAVIDYAFHLIISDPTEQLLSEDLPALIREGYTSFKIYMTYDDLRLTDHQILDLLTVARREGAMVMVHAENADFIDWLTKKLISDGHSEPRYHARARPMAVEREATHRAITMSELADVPILLVHVSAREAVEQIQWAQARGMQIFAETCPQYLVLTEDSLGGPDYQGVRSICSPPPRDKENQKVLWDGLAAGTFHIVSSDHAPFRLDATGKLIRGPKTPFNAVPNGLPGIETRLPILFSEGVTNGRISAQRFVELTATNPAKMYGLYPRKGSLAIGADADIVIYDPKRTVTITNSILHHNVDYTPYEGLEVTGWPEIVLSRGEVIVKDGEYCGQDGRGKFQRCGLPDTAKPRPFI
jgi:dihydropyrimidinase